MFVALAAILYVIAFAMVGVGGYIAADGSQILTLDRGVAYYIGGMSMVTGGAILLGIATLVLCLGFLNRSLKQAAMRNTMHADAEVAPFATVAAAAPAVVGAAVAETVRDEADERQKDIFGEPAGHGHGSAPDALSPNLAAEEVNVAMEGVRRRSYSSSAPEPAVQELEQKTAAEPVAVEADAGVRKSAFGYYSHVSHDSELAGFGADELRPSVDDSGHLDLSTQTVQIPAYEEPATEPEVAVAAEVAPQKPAPTMVGSYESGGNRYVMYSDGSIEAHLPSGVRTFRSLDELKQFVSASSAV